MKLSVDLDALGASSRVGFGQGGRNGDAGSEVHVVGGLPIEGEVRHDGVVLLDVPSGQAFELGERVERVKEEPPVLQLLPEALNHGVRRDEEDLREDPFKRERLAVSVDDSVLVLHAGVHEDLRALTGAQELPRLEEDVDGALRLLFGRDLPAQDLPAEVVDDGVEVGFRPVEQLKATVVAQ